MAINGNFKGARKLAATELHPRHHDGLAKFLSAFGSDGASEALLLPGAHFPSQQEALFLRAVCRPAGTCAIKEACAS